MLDPKRIAWLAAHDDTIPPMSAEQIEGCARLLASGHSRLRLSQPAPVIVDRDAKGP